MPTVKKIIFASPHDVEVAFYEALSRGDLEGIMAVWAEEDDIVCVHPGSPRLIGYAEIREGWAQVFANGQRVNVTFVLNNRHQDPLSAVHHVTEEVTLVSDPSQHAPVISTNIYIRGAHGWRLLVHHASPAPPESLDEAPEVLH